MTSDTERGTTKLSVLTGFSRRRSSVRNDFHPVLVGVVLAKESVLFVGVLVHELAHVLACLWFELEIYEVSYLQRGDIAGFVEFQTPRNYRESFAVFTAPAYLNTLVASTMFLWLAQNGVTVVSVGSASLVELTVLWGALAISANAVPSQADLDNVGTYEYGDDDYHALQNALVSPLLYVFNFAVLTPFLFLDVAWAVGLGYALSLVF